MFFRNSKFCLFGILASVVLAACGSAALTPTGDLTPVAASSTLTATLRGEPTATPTVPAVTSTVEPTATPTDSGDACPPPEPTEMPSVELTNTPVPVTTPEADASAYELAPWDKDAAREMWNGSLDAPVAEEYQNLRGFYRLSLLYEVTGRFPNLITEQEALLAQSNIKRDTNLTEYGLLHNHSSESFRLLLEQSLNNSMTLDWPNLDELLEENQMGMRVMDRWQSIRLFDSNEPAWAVQIGDAYYWGFFIIQRGRDDNYTVYSLFPEWRRTWWSEERMELVDLNANGRDEIAVIYHGWGSGMTHFCSTQFFLFEWDGNAFQNLIDEPFEYLTETDSGMCYGFHYLRELSGVSRIQSGYQKGTVCTYQNESIDYSYKKLITYAWDGSRFRLAPDESPVPDLAEAPSVSSLDWANVAGASDPLAVALLTKAVANWPAEADKIWGPAARDYFRLKLAAWQIENGQLATGLRLLEEVRDRPAAPDYRMAAEIAAAFLSGYQQGGLQRAVNSARGFVENNVTQYDLCSDVWCDYSKLLKLWGFVEPVWSTYRMGPFSNTYHLDLLEFDGLPVSFAQKSPITEKTLMNWLRENQLVPLWSVQTDLDANGEVDWFFNTATCLKSCRSRAFLFLQQGGQLRLIDLGRISYYGNEGSIARRWAYLETARDGLPVFVFQIENRLWGLHVPPGYSVNSGKPPVVLSEFSFEDPYLPSLEIEDWWIEDGQMRVQYVGGESTYAWDDSEQKMIAVGNSVELVEEHVAQAEQWIYLDHTPEKAIISLSEVLKNVPQESYNGDDSTNPQRVKPYVLYLLGLAYETNGDATQAAQTYWQLWNEYPRNPFSLAAQRKLKLTQ